MPTTKTLPHLPGKGIIFGHTHVFDIPFDLTWKIKGPMNYPLPFCQAVLSQGRIWAIGYSQSVEIYQPATDSWSTRNNPFSNADGACYAATTDGKIFAFGLWSQTHQQYNKVVCYDPVSDMLTTKAYMPQQTILGSAVAAQNNKIYLIGGYVQQTDEAIANVQEYDVQANTWQARKPMSVARYGTGAAAIDNEIFVMGGFSDAREELDTLQMFNFAQNTWKDLPHMHVKRRLAPAVTGSNGKIYVLGGLSGCASIAMVEEYDPIAKVWKAKAPMPTGRWGLGAAAIDDKIFALGGLMRTGAYQPGNPNVSNLAAVEVATVPGGSWG